MKKTNKTANGTSFHDVTITATPQQLITILGEPNNNSGDGKVNMEWVCENNNGDLITIYDWKENRPINKWELIDGNILVIYQGDRGQNPKLDFIVKYRKPNCRLRTPSHTHWIVDLIIKHGFSPNVVKDFVLDWLNLYDIIEPFKTEDERTNYELIYNDFFTEKYYDMDNLTEFSVEFLSGIIELFIKCEKQTDNAYMFKNMLKLMMEYCENQKDYYQIISHSKRV